MVLVNALLVEVRFGDGVVRVVQLAAVLHVSRARDLERVPARTGFSGVACVLFALII
jgi:hypothetical protein